MYNAHTSERLPQLCDVINAREQGETARLPQRELHDVQISVKVSKLQSWKYKADAQNNVVEMNKNEQQDFLFFLFRAFL